MTPTNAAISDGSNGVALVKIDPSVVLKDGTLTAAPSAPAAPPAKPADPPGSGILWPVPPASKADASNPPPVITVNPTTLTTISISTVLGAKDDLQAAIDRSVGGDVILLKPGDTWTGNYVLRNRKDSGVVTIRSAGTIPPAYVRIDPKRDRAELATILTPNDTQAISNDFRNADINARGAHHYLLEGLEIAPAPGVKNVWDLVAVADDQAVTHDQLAHNIEFRHLYIHNIEGCDVARGLWPGGKSLGVFDSAITGIMSRGMEAQAIGTDDCPGPMDIINCILEGSSENIIFGNRQDHAKDSPYDPTSEFYRFLPTNITVKYNLIRKPLEWRPIQGVSFKNLIEFKMGQFLIIDSNVMEGSWIGQQNGYVIVLNPRANFGRAPWVVVSDVLIQNNIMRKAAAGISQLMTDYMLDAGFTRDQLTPSKRIKIFNNLFELDKSWTPDPAKWDGGSIGLAPETGDGVEVDHNTIKSEVYGVFFGNQGVPPLPPAKFKLTWNTIDADVPIAAAGSWSPNALPPGSEVHDNNFPQWPKKSTRFADQTKREWEAAYPGIEKPNPLAGADLVKLKLIEDAVRSGDVRGMLA
jgi:hypothetical protein